MSLLASTNVPGPPATAAGSSNRTKVLLMTNTLRGLDAIVARGVITPAERTAMVNVARIVLVSVL